MAELATPFIKYVVWNNDMSAVALLSKHAIIIADKRLAGAQTVHETIRVKSAAWDDSGVLLYTTLNHLKYCLPNGDSGIIRTLDSPLYITRVAGGVVHALDREGKNRAIQVGAGAPARVCAGCSPAFVVKLLPVWALHRQQPPNACQAYRARLSSAAALGVLAYLWAYPPASMYTRPELPQLFCSWPAPPHS